MNKLNNNQLLASSGGINITGALLNSMATIGNLLFEAGRKLGSAIRRMYDNKLCVVSL